MASSTKTPSQGHGRRRSAVRQTNSAVKPRRGGEAKRSSPVAAAKRTAAKAGQAGRTARTAAATKTVRAAAPATAGKPAAPAAVRKPAAKGVVKLTARAARKSAGQAVRRLGERTAQAGKQMVGSAASRAARATASTASQAVEAAAGRARAGAGRARAAAREIADTERLPIQRSLDIAVPLALAWDEWMALEFLPEGVGSVRDIQRDGDRLTGTTHPDERDWEAQILDERERQSFAWRSYSGSDCAGLVTFHQIAERLTRVELNLDVVPAGPLEVAVLATGLAGRRAERELRRFKARIELISPDVYEADQHGTAEADGAEDDQD